jgi:hypothetical protein
MLIKLCKVESVTEIRTNTVPTHQRHTVPVLQQVKKPKVQTYKTHMSELIIEGYGNLAR